jgi:hypothetical protein
MIATAATHPMRFERQGMALFFNRFVSIKPGNYRNIARV